LDEGVKEAAVQNFNLPRQAPVVPSGEVLLHLVESGSELMSPFSSPTIRVVTMRGTSSSGGSSGDGGGGGFLGLIREARGILMMSEGGRRG